MTCAPIIVFVYNRPDHTIALLKNLNESEYALYSDIYIYSDNCKTEQDKLCVYKVREIVNDFKSRNNFKKCEIIISNKNKGLANSVIEGVSDVIERYGRVIVLEDDLLLAPSFLEFMNGALEFYESNTNVWSIGGYTFPIKFLESYKHDIYFTYRESSWGWATWENRWSKVDWQVSGYDHFKWNLKERYRFSKWGKDLPLMLDIQMCSKSGNSWAIRWCYEQFKNRGLTVYPKKSLVKNNGNDGSGTHKSTRFIEFDTELDTRKNVEFFFEKLPTEEEIRKAYVNKYYTNNWIYFKTLVWDVLLRLGLIK